MKRIIATLALTVSRSSRLAHDGPNEMKAIDAALAEAKLDDHQRGASTAALGKAKGILGLK